MSVRVARSALPDGSTKDVDAVNADVVCVDGDFFAVDQWWHEGELGAQGVVCLPRRSRVRLSGGFPKAWVERPVLAREFDSLGHVAPPAVQ